MLSRLALILLLSPTSAPTSVPASIRAPLAPARGAQIQWEKSHEAALARARSGRQVLFVALNVDKEARCEELIPTLSGEFHKIGRGTTVEQGKDTQFYVVAHQKDDEYGPEMDCQSAIVEELPYHHDGDQGGNCTQRD